MRRCICLNGEWNFMPDYQGRPPQEALEACTWEKQRIRVPSSWRWTIDPDCEFKPYDMFEYPHPWNSAQSGMVGRYFSIERTDKNERVYLIIKGALQRSVVAVNGKHISDSSEGYLPLEIDISEAVHEGDDNDLKVWCGPFESIKTETGSKLLVPNGSWFAGMSRGIWQDVFLEYRPNTFIEDVYVKTSVRKQAIEVQVTAVNHSQHKNFHVRATVLDGDKVVKVLDIASMKVEEGKPGVVVLAEKWNDPVYWSPENPHLYRLKTELLVDDRVIDQRETRFGFREVWLDEYRFILNGKCINLKGDAWHYQGFAYQTKEYAQNWYQMLRESGGNFIRLHAMPYPEFFLDAADEMGMLIVDESAIYGSSKMTLSDHPGFIEACRKHLCSLVKRDRNHPSIIIWSMQNEMRWVDGRDRYKAAMPDLTRAMKNLDDTRPISYDGDNRLVDPQEMEIISMHYNIDGTVASWDKKKPLIFGEHGKWHYVSPQVCTDLVGAEAYLSFDACQEDMGINEGLFTEYARREDVTGLTPFNLSNYMMNTMPAEDIRLSWEDLTTPGVKPKVIRAHALTINNGHLKGYPVYKPNPSFKHLQAAFKPVVIFRNEYNTSFYNDGKLVRSFSIYNDTEERVSTRLVYRLTANRKVLDKGDTLFEQMPGERYEWSHAFPLPEVQKVTVANLSLELYHGAALMHTLTQTYKIYPRSDKDRLADLKGMKAAYCGDEQTYKILCRIIPGLSLMDPDRLDLGGYDILIIGRNFTGSAGKMQPLLEHFVSEGGFLLVLEQDQFSFGDVSLSGRRFHSTFITETGHPVFLGVTNEDLRFWGERNINHPKASFLVENGFDKPVKGDLKILLECGDGDFGWGGLLWSALLEYRMSLGKVMINQMELISNYEKVPQAGLLLRNMVNYGAASIARSTRKVGLISSKSSTIKRFLDEIGLVYEPLSHDTKLPARGIIVVDPDALDETHARMLHNYALKGGDLFVLPVETKHQSLLSVLVGKEMAIKSAEIYQVKANSHALTEGLSAYDLYHIEKVTYTPATQQNTPICSHDLHVPEAEWLFKSVKNPWFDYFVRDLNGEYLKVAEASMNEGQWFKAQCYSARCAVGKGSAIISQVLLSDEKDKVKRIYARLLSNLGAPINTMLLRYVKAEKEYGIEAFMSLPYYDYQNYVDMEAYFSDANYLLNNLGEGVYGWMKRAEKREGMITIPDSVGKTYFLTVFIDSEINRDPTRRSNNELPDSSIVPDLFMKVNCACKVFVNGNCYADFKGDSGVQEQKIDDVVLRQGINRMALVVRGGKEDIRLNVWFKNKYGDYLPGLRYRLTLD